MCQGCMGGLRCREALVSVGHLDQESAQLERGWVCIWWMAWARDSHGHFSCSTCPAFVEYWRKFQLLNPMSPKWKIVNPILQASLQLLPGIAETQIPLTRREVLPRTHFSGRDKSETLTFFWRKWVGWVCSSSWKVKCLTRTWHCWGQSGQKWLSPQASSAVLLWALLLVAWP